MLILAVTTSTAQIGVAVGDATGVRASRTAVRSRLHAEMVTPAIEGVCADAGVAPGDVGAVAVDEGPGLFTGLRVGVVTAKTFAFALGIRVVPISGLDLLAFAYRHVPQRVTATIDARRSEVFAASYVGVPGGVQRIVEPHTCTPDELLAELQAEPGPHLVVGNGAHAHPTVFERVEGVVLDDPSYPSVDALVRLGHAAAVRGETVDPEDVECTYLREPDARINWETRDGHVGGDVRVGR